MTDIALRGAAGKLDGDADSRMRKVLRLEFIGRYAMTAGAILCFVACVIFTAQANRILDRHDDHRNTAQVTATLLNVLANVHTMEYGAGAYLSTGNESRLAPFHQGSLELRKNLSWLATLFPDEDAAGVTLVTRLQTLARGREQELLAAIGRQRADSGDDARTAPELLAQARQDGIEAVVFELSTLQQQRREQADARTSAAVQSAKTAFLAWISLLLAVFCLAFQYSSRAGRLLKTAAQRLAEEATHDPLTRLPNRRYLQDWLRKAIARSIRSHEPLTAMFIDLDGFSDINNTLGHEAGDDALVWAARTIQSQIRSADFLARLGGDEFVIICCGPTLGQIEHLAQRLLAAFAGARPFGRLEAGALGLSIGIAQMPADAPDADALLKRADLAMYEAKRAGKRCFRVAG
ncbi:diguanylate cyclase (GGDEF) domain-containing protein [Noviherbaspirillum humi]|uniref:diguanylate cyclase n=1 Tax=Noviherbaspirillum humi TaxID=1688639 RepID=A0A239I166_9BURK|nr:diguanylate cyclase [Noviherbaspirillum humi]SNS87315.1 diguanylate cyclase (GGDEF) domain-containing protein [Noviherbaspirillum humi]